MGKGKGKDGDVTRGREKREEDCGVNLQRGSVATLFFNCQNGVLNLMYIPAMRI